MTKRRQIYKCGKCGNMVEVVHEAGGTLVCCGEPMKLIEENSTDAAKEKHVPVVEKEEGGILVKVGEVEHPMNPDHYIEWIELIAGDHSLIAFLQPGNPPQAEFPEPSGDYTVRAYCNLHGLWRA